MNGGILTETEQKQRLEIVKIILGSEALLGSVSLDRPTVGASKIVGFADEIILRLQDTVAK